MVLHLEAAVVGGADSDGLRYQIVVQQRLSRSLLPPSVVFPVYRSTVDWLRECDVKGVGAEA